MDNLQVADVYEYVDTYATFDGFLPYNRNKVSEKFDDIYNYIESKIQTIEPDLNDNVYDFIDSGYNWYIFKRKSNCYHVYVKTANTYPNAKMGFNDFILLLHIKEIMKSTNLDMIHAMAEYEQQVLHSKERFVGILKEGGMITSTK